MRILSAEGKISMGRLKKGDLDTEGWTNLATLQGRIDSAPLFIDDSSNMTLMEIRAKCRRLKQRNDLKLVVLDYLQLMSSGKKVESRQQEVSEFSRSLKLLAKELDVPVIALSPVEPWFRSSVLISVRWFRICVSRVLLSRMRIW